MRRTTTTVLKVELVDGDDEFAVERPAVTNFKLALLIFFTFGLIVGMYALRYNHLWHSDQIEEVKGVKAVSYEAGGGIIFGIFIVYVILFGVKWYCGAGQRDVLRREAV